MRHGVRSAITPIVTVLGLDLGILARRQPILTETVFNIQGVGRYAYDAIQGSDLPVIQGTRRLRHPVHRRHEPASSTSSTPSSTHGCGYS